MTIRFIPCRECGGSGRHLWSRYGGNDPDVFDREPCEACHGDGSERWAECQEPATDAWIEPASHGMPERVYPLCAEHMTVYVQAAAE